MDELETWALAANNQILQKEETLAQESIADLSQKTCLGPFLISGRIHRRRVSQIPNLPRLNRVICYPLSSPVLNFDNRPNVFYGEWGYKTQKLETLGDRSCGLRFLYRQYNGPWMAFAEYCYTPARRAYQETTDMYSRTISYPNLEVRLLDACGGTRETMTFPTLSLTKGGSRFKEFWSDINRAFSSHIIATEACMYLAMYLAVFLGSRLRPMLSNSRRILDRVLDRVLDQEATDFCQTFHARLLVVQENLYRVRVEIYHHGALGYKLVDAVRLDLPITREDIPEFSFRVCKRVKAQIKENPVFLEECKETTELSSRDWLGNSLRIDRPYVRNRVALPKEFQFYVHADCL